ncbi:MAG: formylglycine-generating enzyme family protein [Hyphomonadaceae bacterium]
MALAGILAVAWWRFALLEVTNLSPFWSVLIIAFLPVSLVCMLGILMMLFAAVFMAPRPDAGAWRDILSLYRATPQLRQKQPDVAKLREASDDALRVASSLPSHSEAGRRAAAKLLMDRGAALTPVPVPVVPGFFYQDQLDKAAGDLFGARETVRATCLVIGGIAAAATIGILGWECFVATPALVDAATKAGVDPAAMEGFGQGSNFTDVPAALLNFPEAQSIVWGTKIAFGCFCFAVVAMLAGRWMAWVRAHPARVLLLRKFNERKLGKYYKRLIREELQPLGHVVALSDKYVRRSMSEWLGKQVSTATSSIPGFIWVVIKFPILLLLRMTDRTRWGPAFIASPRDFRLLGRRLYDRMWLNLETSSFALAYLIRTTDAWWKLVIEMLLKSADVVVLDLSNVTQGTAWEIETIGAQKMWGRTVCIAHDQEYPQAAAALQNAFGGASPPPILTYDSGGAFAEQKIFRDRLVEALRDSVSSRARDLDAEPEAKTRGAFRARAAAIIGVALAVPTIAWATMNWQSMATLVQDEVASAERRLAPVPVAHQEPSLPPGSSFRDCAAGCPEMVVMPGGAFVMGSPAEELGRKPNEGPQHSVTIAPFAVGKFEVTFDEWTACADYGGCASNPKPDGIKNGSVKHPVININWNDVQEYMQWLSAKTGKSYRLLSEAEWEYAARAGSSTAYNWGDAANPSNANGGAASGVAGSVTGADQWFKTAPVGSFSPNPYGLYDMAGNVAEWTQDCANPDYTNAPSDGSARSDGECNFRRVRGGSWQDKLGELRSAARSKFWQNLDWDSIGFRIARDLP